MVARFPLCRPRWVLHWGNPPLLAKMLVPHTPTLICALLLRDFPIKKGRIESALLLQPRAKAAGDLIFLQDKPWTRAKAFAVFLLKKLLVAIKGRRKLCAKRRQKTLAKCPFGPSPDGTSLLWAFFCTYFFNTCIYLFNICKSSMQIQLHGRGELLQGFSDENNYRSVFLSSPTIPIPKGLQGYLCNINTRIKPASARQSFSRQG